MRVIIDLKKERELERAIILGASTAAGEQWVSSGQRKVFSEIGHIKAGYKDQAVDFPKNHPAYI